MNVDDFDYKLPPELIAQQPLSRRDASRMMVLDRRTRRWMHSRFSELPTFLREGDLLVVNNTRVIPARLFARKPGTGGRVEVFLLEESESGTWSALVRSRRRPRAGDRLLLEGGGEVEIIALRSEGMADIRFHLQVPLGEYLQRFGHTPLPPYIRRTGSESSAPSETADRERYQTVYAQEPGSVAAPTAGLHFTEEMFRRLAERGVRRADITLHVGLGTFRPVKAERVEDHRMHEERYTVSPQAADLIRQTRAAGGRIVAVGTTTVRTLETVCARRGEIVADSGRTDLFIYPPFRFRAIDALLTNFHLPKSTLLMLVSAFAGREFVLAAYEEAVRERYRFFSYGDCMLIL
ncbi:MAG: tRNA preQ1(34) S-adenosylmethionine ribosyltransferase-isomerase QueA [Kiritimatiellae bacterium]|nr:tRNA preQ1(34) S-adenosylmethionine ribosyltransferase-isomerase QueA [Kiritimatiellia bacterium]MDW8458052.1 tRNA preQ1(34) S-adenosylmethionine ribosyltransferase-isomerase QueA [Verrucomicrobiota bacterium]